MILSVEKQLMVLKADVKSDVVCSISATVINLVDTWCGALVS